MSDGPQPMDRWDARERRKALERDARRSAPSMFKTIHREIHDARVAALEIVRIRVTADALPGAPVAAPITRERARLLPAPYANEPIETLRELVVHPADWRDLLRDPAVVTYGASAEPTSVFGLSVAHA